MEELFQSALGVFDVGFGPTMPDADIIRTGLVPVEDYVSKERFAREIEVFRHVWLNIGLESEVPKPGDWIVREIEAAPASILVVRDQDGSVKAFHNVCSHRSLKLVWGEKGCDKQFVCPYHAWSYGNDGSLRGVPDKKSFPGLDQAALGLTPVTMEVWKGLIFVHLDAKPRQTLTEFLGGLNGLLEGAPLDEFRYTARLSGIVNSNWKAGLDAASEGYHVQALHRDSAREMVCSKTNPFVQFITIQFLGAHRRMSNPRNPEFALSDAKPIYKLIFESVPQPVVAAQGQKASFDLPGLNPTKAEDWSNDLIAIFPNFQLSLALNGFWTMHYWPLTVDSFRWEAHYHFRHAPRTWKEKFALEGTVALNRDISSEDITCTQQQQAGMATGVKQVLRFATSELLCRHEAAVITAVVDHQEKGPMALAAE